MARIRFEVPERFVFTDRAARKPTPVPPTFLAQLDALAPVH